jgi:hypothetical protein
MIGIVSIDRNFFTTKRILLGPLQNAGVLDAVLG